MTKILMLSISDFDFLTPALIEARMLGNAGFVVEIYTLRNSGKLGEEMPGDRVTIHRWNLVTRSLPKKPFYWFLKYIEFIARALVTGMVQRPAICVAHNLDTLIPTSMLARLLQVKVVYRAHELSGEVAGMPAASLWRRVERRLLKHTDAIVVPNEERGRILMDEYGASKMPLVVMNCPHFSLPVASTLLSDWLDTLGLPGQRIALFQGRLGEDRCIDELVIAGQYLDSENVLVLLGPSPVEYRQHLESLIQQLGLQHKVLLHEPVPYDQLLPYTCSADLGVILYRNTDRNNYYCAPNKLFEYFMAGLPIVAANFPGLVRLVEQSGAGLVVDPTNPIQIANAINTILGDLHLVSLMRNKSLSNAQLYNWEREGSKLLQLYQTLSGVS